MNELFILYKYAFVLCCVAGFTLGIQGVVLTSRKEGLQILPLAQSLLLGSLVGNLFFKEQPMGILFSSWISFVLTKLVFIRIETLSNTQDVFFAAVYFILLAFSYWLISIFPELNIHMTTGLLGDIVSLDNTSTLVCSGILLLSGILFVAFKKILINASFEKTILGQKRLYCLQEFLFSVVFACSLHGLGLIFSVSAMLVPSVFIGRGGRDFKRRLLLICSLAILSSCGGLTLSILRDDLPTVPTQILLLFLGCLLVKMADWKKFDLLKPNSRNSQKEDRS